MSAIGPELPPHLLAKRKRQLEDSGETQDVTPSGAKREASPGEGEKRRRVVGPAPPPAPLDDRPAVFLEEEESSSDDDDGFGPALPSAAGHEGATAEQQHGSEDKHLARGAPSAQEKLRRDDWMMVPPKQDDLAARLDPTKQRARKFNTGKGAKGPSAAGGDNDLWSETPEQKRKRLEDEMMGVSKPGLPTARAENREASAPRDDEAARRIREHTDKTRGKSLYEQHQKTKPETKEDDPSKRAFDREKDIGGGMKIGHSQRKEMLSKASNFSSKFSGGSFL